MPLSSLAPLAGLGSAFGEVSDLAQRQRQMQIRETLAALQTQQLKQQQQAQSGIGNLLGSGQLNSLMGGQGGAGGGGLPQLPQIPQQGGQPPQTPPGLQAGAFGGGMGGGLQQPQAMKASWFGNAPGWSDPSDSGLQAGGKPVSAGPGIALPSRSTLGQQFNVTTPDGRTFNWPQTDIGPAKWTGRGVDINAKAAEQAGYTPKDFPTDGLFKVALANTSPQTQALAGAGTQQAARQIPNILQTAGSWNMDGLAKLIEKTNPDADPEVKGAIFLKMAPLLNEQAKTQAANIFKTYEAGEHQYEFDTSKGLQQQEFQARREDTAAQREQTAAFRAASLAQGQQRIDITKEKAKAGQLPPDAIEVLADQGFTGDQSWKTNLGRGAQGAENIAAVQKRIAEKLDAAGQTGGDLATRNAEFGGLKAGERTLSTRTANIGMRINEAQRFAPLALQASNKVDRTQYPTFNKMEEAYLEGTGDQDVVRLMVYSQSFMNAYAAAVTPTGQPTEGAQARARNNLSIAWSKGQYQAAVDAMLVEMDAASKSPGTVREEFRKGAAAPAAGGQPVTGPTGGGMTPDFTKMTDDELKKWVQEHQ